MSTPTKRALMPDYLRLFALFGIVMVNAQYFAYPDLHGYMAWESPNALDRLITLLVAGLVTMKTYGLFSFMFGVGIAFQMRSAQRVGAHFGRRYARRMIGLALLGIVHGIFFYYGDILLLYALAGSICYTMRNWAVRRLIVTGCILLALQSFIMTMGYLWLPEDAEPLFPQLDAAMADDSFWHVAQQRGIVFAGLFGVQIFAQGISALGWFALGLAAVKSSAIDNPNHAIWQFARRYFLIPSVIVGVLAEYAYVYHANIWGDIIAMAIAPCATFGYLGLIARIAQPRDTARPYILTAGESSLSIYLGQSIVLSFIFAGYGLGGFNTLSPWWVFVISIITTLLLCALILIWRRTFAMGPLEWLLRKFTY